MRFFLSLLLAIMASDVLAAEVTDLEEMTGLDSETSQAIYEAVAAQQASPGTTEE